MWREARLLLNVLNVLERWLSKEVDKKGRKNAIVYIVPRLNVMVPPEFFLLHCIILKEVISLFRYRRLLSIVSYSLLYTSASNCAASQMRKSIWWTGLPRPVWIVHIVYRYAAPCMGKTIQCRPLRWLSAGLGRVGYKNNGWIVIVINYMQ
jgi:hypothetical protein